MKKQYKIAIGVSAFAVVWIALCIIAWTSYHSVEKHEAWSPVENQVQPKKEYVDLSNSGNSKAVNQEPKKKEVKKEVNETPKQKMAASIIKLFDSKQAFDSGSYVQGDIPAGEYAFVSFEGNGKYYVEKDSANEIIDNENFNSFGYVHVYEKGNLKTDGILINVNSFPTLGVKSAKQIYEVLNEIQNYKDGGYYKVGVDIPAGKYTLESYGEGYVAIMTGPVGKSDIVDNEVFNGKYSISVNNGQFLKINRATIIQ